MVAEQSLLNKIEAFLEATNTNPTQFGVEAIKDGKLVFELRTGRQLRLDTRERVEEHLRKKTAEAAAKLTDVQERLAS